MNGSVTMEQPDNVGHTRRLSVNQICLFFLAIVTVVVTSEFYHQATDHTRYGRFCRALGYQGAHHNSVDTGKDWFCWCQLEEDHSRLAWEDSVVAIQTLPQVPAPPCRRIKR